MGHFSRKLGPQARRIAASRDHQIVEGVVEITRDANLSQLQRDLERLGAEVHGASRNTGYVRINIPADHLRDVADVSDVIYVEADDVLHGIGS